MLLSDYKTVGIVDFFLKFYKSNHTTKQDIPSGISCLIFI